MAEFNQRVMGPAHAVNVVAKSLVPGQKDAAKILETIAEDQLREVI